jgi:predicted outer membrane repeat protein
MLLVGNTGTTESHGVNVGGFLRITNSKITNMNGSGILYGNGGGLLMDSCTISQNAGGVSTGGSGGGITFGGAVDGNPPKGFGFSQDSLVIRNSTISDNTATGDGGGFDMTVFTGTLLLQNSTIMFNSANGSGGGVFINSGSGSVTLQSCTMIGNTALANSATTGGGGIARISTTPGMITIANSVVSGNHNTPAVDIRASSATTTVVNFSAIGSNPGFTLAAGSGNNLAFGTNLQFTVDHVAMGGSTVVVAFAPTSPLINAGSNSLAAGFTTDQRGQGFARISDGTVDIGSVERQPYFVTTTADSGIGSLRNALSFADSDPSADEIDFDTSGVFATPQTISLLTEPEGVDNPLTIVGPGSSRLTIQEAPSVPAFRLLIDSSPSLTIIGVTISGFSTTTTAGQKAGGAIWALSTSPSIALDDVVLSNNTAGTDGGAIAFTTAGFLAIRNSVLSNNTATGAGGGASMAAGGLLVVENTTFSGNTANGATGGGAISFSGQATVAPPAGFISATLDIHTSTFSGNTTTTGPGGAFALTSFTGTFQLRNSTFANNTAAASGGGVALVSGSGAITVQDSTISNNTASGSTAGTGGGGIARTSTTSGTITVANSIVSGDQSTNAPDILAAAGTTTNVNFSAVGSATGFALSVSSGNNLAFGANLQLGALTSNGGATQTMLPSSTSPLVNAGSNTLVPSGVTSDQRGGQFPRIQGGTVDIGAVETQPAPPAVALSSFVFATAPVKLTFTFTQDVSASLSSGDLQVQLDGDGLLSGITYLGYDSPTNTATFTLPQAISDGNYCAQFVAGSVANANGSVPSSFEFDFFVFNGDANHDRVVNALDFNALATNFGQSGRSYAQGDFNYDGTVNTLDFTALASRFNTSLSAPLAAGNLGAAISMSYAPQTLDIFSKERVTTDQDANAPVLC